MKHKMTIVKTTDILKVIVGSHAHGLATAESDMDYRGVFVRPTEEILKIGGSRQRSNWQEGGEEDSTAWEIEHFLSLSLKSNPTILETYLAPLKEEPDTRAFSYSGPNTYWGNRLRELFPYVWSSSYVVDAFIGYGLNQRKKFLDNKDKRAAKYAAAYLRTLYNGWELLVTGTFTIRIVETEVGETVKRWKGGDFGIGEVIETCSHWQAKLEETHSQSPVKFSDIDRVNNFLLEVRKNFWGEK